MNIHLPRKIKNKQSWKLIPNLNNSTNYVLHYENLKLYESLGLKNYKDSQRYQVWRSAWLMSYIDLNTSLRAKIKNEFEKTFSSFMNNASLVKPLKTFGNEWTLN